MKKTITAITLLAGAATGYSQGLINFNAYVSGFKIGFYNAGASDVDNYSVTYNGYTVSEVLGNNTATHEAPTGTAAYTGAALSGTGYSAELLVGPAGISSVGGTVLEGGTPVGLTPWGGGTGNVLTFHTGAANSQFISGSSGVTLPTEDYYAVGDNVSEAIAVWNNDGGTLTTLAAAQQAGEPWGIGNVVQGATSGPPGTGSALPTTLESFSLGTSVPEPSTIALGVMGASALLFRRRK